MPVNLSIKNVPDDLAQRLRERAARNHRSVQGELMALVEDALAGPPGGGMADHTRPYRTESLQRIGTGEAEMEDAMEIIKKTQNAGIPQFGKGTLNVDQIVKRISKLGLPRVDDAARLVREDRDSR